MSFYGSQPVGVIFTGHQHVWQGNSGSSYSVYDFPEPVYIDWSVAVCDYCRNRYMSSRVKSGEISSCLGCGAYHFHFERM